MVTERLCLFSYWRSSAAYRVRIGLNLKALAYDIAPVHLLRDGGEQHSDAFRETNPQQLVPVLQHGGRMLRQSLAILEYLDEMWPEPPLLPATARERQRVRGLAQLVACDIHPLNNLRVLGRLRAQFSADNDAVKAWIGAWIAALISAWAAVPETTATGVSARSRANVASASSDMPGIW